MDVQTKIDWTAKHFRILYLISPRYVEHRNIDNDTSRNGLIAILFDNDYHFYYDSLYNDHSNLEFGVSVGV